MNSFRVILSYPCLLSLILFTEISFAQAPAVGTIPGVFDVSSSGAAEYTIPIQIAPGTAGTAPSLSISYKSNTSTGILGAGWGLNGTSAITRGPKSIYTDGIVEGVRLIDSDALYLDGIRLIEVSVTGTGENKQIEYRKEADDVSRIIKYGATLASSRFVVQTKGGVTLHFNGSNGSTINANGTALLWVVSRIVDTPGNFIEFHYQHNQQGDYAVSSIRYTGHELKDEVGNLISFLNPYASVDFEYDNIARPIDTYIAGRLIRRTYRLKSISSKVSKVRSAGPSTGWPLVTRYQFEYEDRNTHNRFVLKSVRQFGDDGSELQPTQFNYSQPQTGWTEANFQLPVAVLAGEEKLSRGYQFAHLTDGGTRLVDLLFSALIEGKLESFAFQNEGGRWVSKDVYKPPFAFVSGDGTDLGALVIDLNGDGRSDLLQSYQTSGQVPINNAYIASDEGWKSAAGYILPFVVSVDGKRSGKYIFGPFSGTGRLDLLYDVGGVRGFLVNTGTQWQSDPNHIPPISLTNAARALDVNGDGSIELLAPADNQWKTYQFTAAGWDQMPTQFELPLPGDLPDAAIAQIDLNTDGNPDIVAASAKANIRKALVASSDGWKEDALMSPTFDLVDQRGTDIGAVLVDVNLDGRLDIIANRTDSDGQVVRYAFSQSSTGWSNLGDSFFLPTLLERRQNTPDIYAMVGDIDGDGFKDIANPSGTRVRFGQVFAGTSSGFEEKPEFVPPVAFTRKDQQDRGVRFVDLNADGLPDVIFRHDITKDGATTQVAGAYVNSGNGWKLASGLTPPQPIAADWISGNPMQLVDVDGDGFIDMLYSYRKTDGTLLRGYYKNSLAQDGSRKWVEQPNSTLIPPAMYPFAIEKEGDQGVQMVDLNSDGRVDMLISKINAKTPQNPEPVENCTIVNGQQQCSLNRTLFSGTAFLNDGTGWKETPTYTSPLPFVAKPERAIDAVKHLFVQIIDIDGDRLPDLVARFKHPHKDTYEVNEVWLNTGTGWRLSPVQVPVFLDESYRNDRASNYWLDVNGDGLGDLLYSEKRGNINHSKTWLSTGNGFKPADEWKIPLEVLADQAYNQGFVFTDLNGDGLSDIIYSRLLPNGQHERGASLNNGSTWVTATASAVEKVPAFNDSEGHDLGVRLIDVDGNGLPDIIKAYNQSDGGVAERLSLLNTGRRSEVLLEVLPGYNAKTIIVYQTLLEVLPSNSTGSNAGKTPWARVYTPAALESQYPYLSPVPTTYVVRQTSSEIPGHMSRQFYRYGDFRLHATALQPLGYGWREVYDEASAIVTRSEYARNIEIVGKPVRESSCWVRFSENPDAPNVLENLCPSGPVAIPWITKLSEATNTWERTEFIPGVSSATAKIGQVYLESTTTETWELDRQLVARETTRLTYDTPQAYLSRKLNVMATQVTRLDGTRNETKNEYEQEDQEHWLLGRLTKATITKTGDPTKGNPAVRKTELKVTAFTYDPTTGLLISSTIEPGDPKAVTTTYKRDKYGNIEKTILSAIGVQARTSSSIFDILGRFVIEETNALEHKTSYKRNEKTGEALTVIDPNEFQVTFTYDGFGRMRTETGRTGVTKTIKKINSTDITNEDKVGLNVAYAEQVTVGTLPPVLQLYDPLGRIVRTITQGFTLDEKALRWIQVDRSYDRLGRVEKESLPYERGKQPLWHRMTYDALGRTILVVQPDGNKKRTEYRGRAGGGQLVTSFNPKNHRTLTELNTRLLPVAVTDELGGKVTYEYDAGDRLEVLKGPTGAVTVTKYDKFGQRNQVSDPDLGVWTYKYDAFGQLAEQKDAMGQVTTLDYDRLGRIKSKSLSDGTTLVWEYDGSARGVGSLQRISDVNRFEQTFFYDALGRSNGSAVSIGLETFKTTTEWDEYDRPRKTQYPVRLGTQPFVVENVYDAKGFLKRVQSDGGLQRFWEVFDIDEFGRVVKEEYGNGVETVTTYNKNTGELEGTRAKRVGGSTILDLNLEYDAVGSLLKRHELVQNIKETFTYDPLDRLKSATRSGMAAMVFDYDAAGRFKKKPGIEKYGYASDAQGGSWQPYHAVLETRNGGEVKKYSYDLNGNRKSGNGREIKYTPDNLVREVSIDDTHWVQFDYGPSGNRYRQKARNGEQVIETLYLGGFEEVKEFKADNQTQPKRTRLNYKLSIGGEVFAIVERTIDHENLVATTAAGGATLDLQSTSSTSNIWYLHKDQLGSVVRVTSESGSLAVRYWYDPWGRQTEMTILSAGEKFGENSRQGFTGHEQLAMVGLIHMNGRVYDFETGMFLSADPVDLVTGYTQTIGRYAYVQNNPLKYTDPTGYWSIGGSFIGGVVGFVTGGVGGAIVGAVIGGNDKTREFVKENWREIAVVTVAVGVTIATGGSGAILAGMAAGAASGATRAALYGGDFGDILGEAIKGGVIGGISGAAFYGVGEAAPYLGGADSFGSIGAHGIIGGGMSELEQSGSFWKGFASGALTKASSVYGPQMSGFGANVVRAAVVGGTVAEICGGKFANGAIIGAYSYALNDALHSVAENGRSIASESDKVVSQDEAEYAAYIESIDPPIESLGWLQDAVLTAGMSLGASGTAAALRATGGMKQWIRFKPSYSHTLNKPTWGVQWGAGRNNWRKIGNPTLQQWNRELRATRAPFGGWRSAEPGHFHIKTIKK